MSARFAIHSFKTALLARQRFLSKLAVPIAALPSRVCIPVNGLMQRFSSSSTASAKSINIGDTCQVQRTFTADDVKLFAQLSGDFNEIHSDDSVAQKYNFSRAIVHGALVNGVISGALGTILPGQGSILLEQELHFPNPLYIGEQFDTKVTIADIKRNVYICNYECATTSDGKKVVWGKAKILLRAPK